MRALYFKEKNLTDILIYEEKYDVISSVVLHLLSPGVELIDKDRNITIKFKYNVIL